MDYSDDKMKTYSDNHLLTIAPTASRRTFIAISAAIVLGLPAFAKRMMPKRVEPLADGQVVYTAPSEAMGFVVALDAVTKKELWRAQIYQVVKNPDLEGDVQDVFITKLAKDGGTLIVTDERNRTFRLDLTTKNVTPVDPVAK